MFQKYSLASNFLFGNGWLLGAKGITIEIFLLRVLTLCYGLIGGLNDFLSG